MDVEIKFQINPEELSTLLGQDLKKKLIDQLLNGSISLNTEITENISESDSLEKRKYELMDDLSWTTFYLYDLIRATNKMEIDNYFLIDEAGLAQILENKNSLGKNIPIKYSMIIGGATQVSNRHKLPPFLKIFTNNKKKRYGANKFYLDAFLQYKLDYLTDYKLEVTERNLVFVE